MRMFVRVSIGTLDAQQVTQVTTGTSSVGMQMRNGQKPAQEKSEKKASRDNEKEKPEHTHGLLPFLTARARGLKLIVAAKFCWSITLVGSPYDPAS